MDDNRSPILLLLLTKLNGTHDQREEAKRQLLAFHPDEVEAVRFARFGPASPNVGTPEYERMVDAGERAALDSEMESGWRYSQEDAVIRLRRIMVARANDGTPITLQPDTCRYLLAHIDRLEQAEKELFRFRKEDLARRMADSQATLRESLEGKPCPTCTKPLPENHSHA